MSEAATIGAADRPAPAIPRALLDMLGARWRVGARASAIAWAGSGAAAMAGYALSDGSLAVARLAWEGGPSMRPREGGGVELVPPSTPPPAIARLKVHDGAVLALAADPDGGFLSGGADGQLARVQADGVIDTLARFAGLAAAPLAAGKGGWRVCAAGRTLHRIGGGGRSIDLPNTVTALAVAPDGSRVAIGHAGGVTLWAGGDAPRRLTVPGIQSDLAWSPDARHLASATREGDVALCDVRSLEVRPLDAGRGMRRSLAFTADGAFLVTGASGSVACWNLATRQLEPCGPASREAVLRIACHPSRNLIAAGTANGAVLICRPASSDAVCLRAAGEGAGGGGVDALEWSADGGALAFAVAGGEIGLADLPPLLFRDPIARPAGAQA